MKTVILSVAATLVAVGLAAALFLNTILGVFGLAATSIDALQNLRASQQVVEKMKKRHAQKKLDVSRKLAKGSAKRVASTALAAATVGTVGVAVTMASFEVAKYCEEKEELQDDANILYETNVAFDFDRCIEEGKKDSKRMLEGLKNSSVEAVADAFDESARYSSETWAAIRAASVEAFQAAGAAVGELWDATRAWLAPTPPERARGTL